MESINYQTDEFSRLTEKSEKASKQVKRTMMVALATPVVMLVVAISAGITIIKFAVPEFQQAEILEITKVLTALEETRIENPNMTTPETPVTLNLSTKSKDDTIAIIPETKPTENLVTAEEAQRIYEMRKKLSAP